MKGEFSRGLYCGIIAHKNIMALIIGKFLEINTKLSLKHIIDVIWFVTDAKLYDNSTNNRFSLHSELNQSSIDVGDKINIALSY